MNHLSKRVAAVCLPALLALFIQCSESPTGVTTDNHSVITPGFTPEFSKKTTNPEQKLIKRLDQMVNHLSRIDTRLNKVLSHVPAPDPALFDVLNRIRSEAEHMVVFANDQLSLLGRDQPELRDRWNRLIDEANRIIVTVDANLVPPGREPVEPPGHGILNRLEKIADHLAKLNRKLERIFGIEEMELPEFEDED